jgi:hypothetical protein
MRVTVWIALSALCSACGLAAEPRFYRPSSWDSSKDGALEDATTMDREEAEDVVVGPDGGPLVDGVVLDTTSADATVSDGAASDASDTGIDARSTMDVPSDDGRADGSPSDSMNSDSAPPCPVGQTSCSGVCVDTNTSMMHCGACGRSCPARANARPQCSAGGCGFVCDEGFGDCDGIEANGCEVNLSNNPRHCGMCNNSCSDRAGGTAVCESGTCRLQCEARRGDCDGNATNGCETLLVTSSHCGSCGTTCGAGQVCDATNAIPRCVTAPMGCAATTVCTTAGGNRVCTNLLTDPLNCGACNNACIGMGTLVCVNGRCGQCRLGSTLCLRPPNAGLCCAMDCSGTCVVPLGL